MSIKLTGNGLWESSRMMLPEHKERIIEHNLDVKKKQKHELDDQEWEQINLILIRSMVNEEAVTVVIFGEKQDDPYRGVVDRFDSDKVRVGKRWISFLDIVAVKGN